MRLIDADALLNRMQEDPLFYLVERYGVSGVIEAEPTVDAVPVIRCKDCKEYAEWGDSMICMRLGSYYGNTKPNEFCSRAERKDNETD